MEEYKRLAAVKLTANESSLYSNSKGAIVKTILLHNTNESDQEVTLSFDSVIFMFQLKSKETLLIDKIIITNSIKALGSNVNIHISGIQL